MILDMYRVVKRSLRTGGEQLRRGQEQSKERGVQMEDSRAVEVVPALREVIGKRQVCLVGLIPLDSLSLTFFTRNQSKVASREGPGNRGKSGRTDDSSGLQVRGRTEHGSRDTPLRRYQPQARKSPCNARYRYRPWAADARAMISNCPSSKTKGHLDSSALHYITLHYNGLSALYCEYFAAQARPDGFLSRKERGSDPCWPTSEPTIPAIYLHSSPPFN